MSKSEVLMGQLSKSWKEKAKSITFSVTEDCNLACKYCYMTGKNSKNKMNYETAKKVVDYVLANRQLFPENSVIWDFIGGEPFLEIDLIDRLCDYIKKQMFLLDHPWFNSYRFAFSTNGLTYDTPKVQAYISKNKTHLSIGVSVDGNKIKHDMQRVRKDGTGSYDDVMKIVPLWMKQFPGSSTKATFAHDDLPYLKDSIIDLWGHGIKIVAANVVFEDVWHEGDDVIYENQLRELADYILDNKLWNEYSVRFFDPHIGFPLVEEDLDRNYCGAGRMMAVNHQGRFFPCVRFLDFSLNNREGICIGDVEKGLDMDKLRPFYSLTLKAQSREECIKCPVATGCAWCTGFNYDDADNATIYQRAMSICKMHKANVRACEYFWNKYTELTGEISPREEYRRQRFMNDPDSMGEQAAPKYLQIMTSDDIAPHCTYKNWKNTNNKMDDVMIRKAVEFARKNGFGPVLLGNPGGEFADMLSIVGSATDNIGPNSIVVYDNDIPAHTRSNGNCILLVNRDNINNLEELAKELYKDNGRINIILEDIDKWKNSDIEGYKKQLDRLTDFVAETYRNGNPIELNILTDMLNLKKMCNCDSGNRTFTLAPNGKIYICPAFYLDNPEDSIGDLENGISIKNPQLLELDHAYICSNCDANHCRRCKYLNKKLTYEINTPSKIQCLIGHIERNQSMKLQKLLAEQGYIQIVNEIKAIDYMDPLEKIARDNEAKTAIKAHSICD